MLTCRLHRLLLRRYAFSTLQQSRQLSLQQFKQLQQQLVTDGYCVVPNVLDEPLRSGIQDFSLQRVAKMTPEEQELHRFTGSLIPTDSQKFAALIANARTQAALSNLGFDLDDTAWMSGFIISKPPKSPSLAWHQDSWYWDEACAYQEAPVQLFVMLYLTDTTVSNGCLRVLPGTHRRVHRMHSVLSEQAAAHSDAVRALTGEEEQHMPVEGMVDVCVKAGDAVIGDARVLHGAHPNMSDQHRTLITLWYMPSLRNLPDTMQKQVAKLHLHQCGAVYDWPPEDRALLGTLLPPLHGLLHSREDIDKNDHNLNFMVRSPDLARMIPT